MYRLLWPLKTSKVEFICQGIDVSTNTSPFGGLKTTAVRLVAKNDLHQHQWFTTSLIYAYQRLISDDTASNIGSWRSLG